MSDDPTPIGLVLAGLNRVERTLGDFQARVNTQLDALDSRFIPRGEFAVRFEGAQADRVDLHGQITAEEIARTGDVQRLFDRIDQLEERRRADRRFTTTSLLTVAGLLLTLLAIVVSQWH